jgi:hypothetical protein
LDAGLSTKAREPLNQSMIGQGRLSNFISKGKLKG